MSSRIGVGYDPIKAMRYNSRSPFTDKVPTAALLAIPELAFSPKGDKVGARRAFADAVRELQKRLGFDDADCDGAYGPTTHGATARAFDPVSRSARYVMHGGRRLAIEGERSSRLVGLDDDDARDLHRRGKFRRDERRRVKRIMVHWGGRDVDHLFRYFAGTQKSVSSHFGCSGDIAAQYLDTDIVAYHAGGWYNLDSIGIDCAQFPQPDRVDWYNYRDGDDGDDIAQILNPERGPNSGGRGLKYILSLDSRTARTVRELVFDLCYVHGIEPRAPRGADGRVSHKVFSRRALESDDGPTVIAHHHYRQTKVDVIGWWGSIFNGTVLGD